MAWLPRSEFCSPKIPTASSLSKKSKKPRQESIRPYAKTSRDKTDQDRSKDVLPRLWDLTCGTFINQSFSQKRLFAEPKRKLLLPITDKQELERRKAKEMVNEDGGDFRADFPATQPFFSGPESPLSQIMRSAKAELSQSSSPRREAMYRFSDDNDVKITPNIARLRLTNALRKSAESSQKQKGRHHSSKSTNRILSADRSKSQRSSRKSSPKTPLPRSRSRSRDRPRSTSTVIQGRQLSSSSSDDGSSFGFFVPTENNGEWSD